MITDKEINATLLSPTKKDYYQVWMELLELASKISERWDPTSTNESDPGIVLLKVLTGITDKLNYTIDKNILEAYMPSAAQEESMRKLCDMMGYSMKYYRSATTDITVYYSGKSTEWQSSQIDDSTTTYLILPKFTQFKNADGDIIYTSTDQITLTKSNPLAKVNCIEGSVNLCAEDNDGIVTLNNIDDNYRYYLPVSQVAENGIFIYNTNSNILSNIWTQVDNLNTQPLESRVYKFGYDSKEMLPYIQFPSDISSLIEDGLYIYYTLTSGASGNISAKTISTFEAPSEWTIKNEGETTAYNTTGITHFVTNFMCYNGSATTNGANKETIDNAYNSFKKTIGTFDTLVTCRDYMNKIYNLTVSQVNTTPVVSNIIVSDIKDDISSAVTLCSFNGYGISYNAKALTVPYYDVEATAFPSPSITYFNKVYKVILNEEGANVTYYKKCVKLTDDTYAWGEVADTTSLLTNFDLVLYPFKTIYGLNTKAEYDSSFKYDDATSTLTDIEEKLEDSKTIVHNFKTPTDLAQIDNLDKIICIKNYLKLNARITTTSKVSTVEWSAILDNIKAAIYENFNCRQLDFSEEIPFDSILKIIENADSRIKNVSLEDPDLYTAIMLQDNTEYFIGQDDEDYSTIKANIIAKFTSTEKTEYAAADDKDEYIAAKIIKAKELSNKIALRNILAGRVPLFNYDEDFGTSITESADTNEKSTGETYDVVYGQRENPRKIYNETTQKWEDAPSNTAIKYITSDLIIKKATNLTEGSTSDSNLTAANADDTLFNTPISDNEVIQFRAPNFRTSITYPAYVNYYIKLTDAYEKYAIPATMQTLYTYFNETHALNASVKAARFTQFMNSTAGNAENIPDDLISVNTQEDFETYKNIYGGLFSRVSYIIPTTTPTEYTSIHRVKYNNMFYTIDAANRYKLESGTYVQDNAGAYLKVISLDSTTATYVKIVDYLYAQSDSVDATTYEYIFTDTWNNEASNNILATANNEAEKIITVNQPITASETNKAYVQRMHEPDCNYHGETATSAITGETKAEWEAFGAYRNCYRNSNVSGGWARAINGNPYDPKGSGCNILSNCVGYAQARFNEVYYYMSGDDVSNVKKNKFWYLNCNPNSMIKRALAHGLEVGDTPKVGSILVLGHKERAGHVLVVEQVNADGSVNFSESNYKHSSFKYEKNKRKGSSGSWGQGTGYYQLGFIYNPAVKAISTTQYKVNATIEGNGTFDDGSTSITDYAYKNKTISFRIKPTPGYSLNASGVEITGATSAATVSVVGDEVTISNIEAAEVQTNADELMAIDNEATISIKLTLTANPVYYLYPLDANTFDSWNNFITSCRDYTLLRGLYRKSNVDTSRSIGRFIDTAKNKYLLTSYVSTSDPLKYYYVQDTNETDIATEKNTNASTITYGHTKDGLGANAVVGTVKADAEYKLKEGEYLCINYTSADATGTDETGAIATTSEVVNTYYGPGTIIKPNFAIQDSAKKKTEGTSYAKTSGFDFRSQLGTETSDYGIPGMYSLGYSETIEIRQQVINYVYDELNTATNNTNPVYVYFMLNNESSTTDTVFLENGESYTLQEGEYFWYTDRNKQTLTYCGDGCVVTNHSNFTIKKSASATKVTVADIFENGIDVIPWITITGLNIKDITNPGGTSTDNYIEWDEYQYINLGAGDKLISITPYEPVDEESNDIQIVDLLTNEWRNCGGATYLLSGASAESTLPDVASSGNGNWEVRSKLIVSMNPDYSQTLINTDENQSTDSGNKLEGISIYSSDPDAPATSAMVEILAQDRYESGDAGYSQKDDGDFWRYPSDGEAYYNIKYDYASNRYSLVESVYVRDNEGNYWNTALIEKFFGISLKANYFLNTSSDKIKTSYVVTSTDTETEVEDFVIRAIEQHDITSGETDKSVLLNTVNDRYTKLSIDTIFDDTNPTAYSQLYCTLNDPNENYVLLMMYYNTQASETSKYASIRLVQNGSSYAPTIFNYPNIVNSTWWEAHTKSVLDNTYYCLKPGINIIKISNSCTINIYSGKQTDDTIVFDNLRLINQSVNYIDGNATPVILDYGINLDLLQYYNTTPTNDTISQTDLDRAKQLLTDINSYDIDHEFYYSMYLDDSVALNINTAANENLQMPLVQYDYNNINNKFVISEIDSDYLSTGIVLARSSSK